ncbi:MAG: 50S ribosomal protein L10 [Candidatus Omnitrophica bacterium]|nr:50S ribosomal protein L10 [Candidatus Omnitrophota bacterium]
MKKLSTIFKEASENRIKKGLKDSEAFFVVKYSKLSGPDLNALRKSLRGIDSEMLVVRNNTARRALAGQNEALINFVQGPCGFVFSKKEPVAASKVLFNFTKDHANLILEGGLLKDKLLNSKDIEALAKLPSREVLLTKTVMAIKSPITGFVFVLKGNLRKLVFCLEQIKQKKQ